MKCQKALIVFTDGTRSFEVPHTEDFYVDFANGFVVCTFATGSISFPVHRIHHVETWTDVPASPKPGNPIDWNGWSVRVHYALCRMGVLTWQQLAAQTAELLLSHKNFGPLSLKEVRARLDARGLALRGDPTPPSPRHGQATEPAESSSSPAPQSASPAPVRSPTPDASATRERGPLR